MPYELEKPRCQKCGRGLPPNGNCMYCGTLDASGGEKKRTPFWKSGISFIRNLLFIGIFGFLLYFFIMTEGGRKIATRVIQGIHGFFVVPSEAEKLLMEQVPGLQVWEEENPGALNFKEGELGNDRFEIWVSYYDGSEVVNTSFIVNVKYRTVEPQDHIADRLMEK